MPVHRQHAEPIGLFRTYTTHEAEDQHDQEGAQGPVIERLFPLDVQRQQEEAHRRFSRTLLSGRRGPALADVFDGVHDERKVSPERALGAGAEGTVVVRITPGARAADLVLDGLHVLVHPVALDSEHGVEQPRQVGLESTQAAAGEVAAPVVRPVEELDNLKNLRSKVTRQSD